MMHRRKFLQCTLASSSGILLYSQVSSVFATHNAVQEFTLPQLSYSFDALEPNIDKQTMEIHYTKHHDAYVKNLNKEVVSNSALAGKRIEDILKKYQ